jgi:hypothetical protein
MSTGQTPNIMEKINITFLSLDIDALIEVKKLLGNSSTTLNFHYLCQKLESRDQFEQFDTIVSPANSYGEYALQKRIYTQIGKEYYGEIPIGSSSIVDICPANNEFKHPAQIIMCPTMVIPMNVDGTRNAYLFMKALLKALRDNYTTRKFKNVLVPLPCIGVGEMDTKLMAKQLKVAVQAFEGCGIIRAIHMNTENENEIRNNPRSPNLNEYQPNNVLQNARMAFVQLVKR